MKKYLLYLLPNALFFVTLSIEVLKKGTFNPLLEGSFIALFLLTHAADFFKPYLFAALGCVVSFMYPHHMLEIISLSMAGALSASTFTELKQEAINNHKNQKLATFFEKLAKQNVETIASLQDKLDTFLMQEVQGLDGEDSLLPLTYEPYDESLDFIEQKVSLSLDPKDKRQPLRRLRRIMTKQTSFLDEVDSD